MEFGVENGHVERSFDLSVFGGGSSVEVFPAAAGAFFWPRSGRRPPGCIFYDFSEFLMDSDGF